MSSSEVNIEEKNVECTKHKASDNCLGPGPGAYMLPPCVGFEKHDPSRYRNPQYTMRPRHTFGGKASGPGPQYNIDKMTRYGKCSPPAFSIAPRLKTMGSFKTPGPGTYSPEKAPRMKDPRPPAYSMAARFNPPRRFNTPGPNQYSVPTTIGPKVPDKPAAVAYSMTSRQHASGKQGSPGPAQYGGTNVDLYKNRNPQYSMGARTTGVSARGATPGPAAYLPGFKEQIPGGISFGRRVNKLPYITADDHMPCVD